MADELLEPKSLRKMTTNPNPIKRRRTRKKSVFIMMWKGIRSAITLSTSLS